MEQMKYVLIIRFKKIFKNQIIKEISKKNITEKLKKIGLIVKWTHGAGQKFLYYIKQELKYKCQHGEDGKCSNCIEIEFISNAKYISFDQFINY